MSVEGRRGGAALVGVVLLVLLHFLARPYLLGWWGSPDLAVAGLLVAALHLRPGWAAGVGFVLGLLEGAIALGGIGPLAMAYAVVGYGAARSWALLLADIRLFLPVYFFLGGWLLITCNQWVTTSDLTLGFIFLRAPLAALLTAAVAGIAEAAGGGFRAG